MQMLGTAIADGFSPVSLSELDNRAALQRRTDRKYFVSGVTLEALLAALTESHAVLEIDGTRIFGYRNVYFDSPSLLTYREHVQRRRRRFKVRSRHYVDSDQHWFEVKLKGRRSQTVKERVSSSSDLHGVLAPTTLDFLRETLSNHYGKELTADLAPTLHMRYSRVTLACLNAPERLTIDVDLRFAGANGLVSAMAPEWAILESKSAHGRAEADHLLRTLGVRPVDCSKYCLGITLTRPEVRGNRFLWHARRHFPQQHTPSPSDSFAPNQPVAAHA
jgi:hypothetical protein